MLSAHSSAAHTVFLTIATATKEGDKLNRNLLSPGVWQQNYHNAVYDLGFLPVTTAVKLDRHWLVDFRYVWWRMEEEQRQQDEADQRVSALKQRLQRLKQARLDRQKANKKAYVRLVMAEQFTLD